MRLLPLLLLLLPLAAAVVANERVSWHREMKQPRSKGNEIKTLVAYEYNSVPSTLLDGFNAIVLV